MIGSHGWVTSHIDSWSPSIDETAEYPPKISVTWIIAFYELSMVLEMIGNTHLDG